MQARPFVADDSPRWDELCAHAGNATFLHTRRFLSYHGNRFEDRSLIFEQDGRWLGLLPAACSPGDPQTVVSHPGITYGGLLHDGKGLRGESALRALELACGHYARQGHRQFRYKVLPFTYQCLPAQDDLYALFRLGARRYRCDLSCTIDLARPGQTSDRRRRALKQFTQAGLRLDNDLAHLKPFWAVLEEALASRHGVNPAHTAEEIDSLARRFPEEIALLVALDGNSVVAGIILFRAGPVAHAQYSASSPAGRRLAALDGVFDSAIRESAATGCRYFDFGVSTEDQGRHLNESLHQYKAEFGGSGVVHEFYELDL